MQYLEPYHYAQAIPLPDTLLSHIGGVWGLVAYRVPQAQPLFVLNPHQVFPAASVIKFPILVELYRQAVEEGLDLQQSVRVTDKFRVDGSGLLQSLSDQVSMTRKDLAILMMQISDNAAANVLIETLGREKINQTMEQIGLTRTKLWQERIEPLAAQEFPETMATTTPRDMALLLAGLSRGEILTPLVCQEILSLMKRDRNKRRICGQLPFRPDLTVYHKTGTLYGTFNDIGLIHLGQVQYVISILSKRVTDSADPQSMVVIEETMARLSRWIFNEMSKGELS